MEELAASNAAVSSELAAKGRQLRDLVKGLPGKGGAEEGGPEEERPRGRGGLSKVRLL